ncbi:MAG: AlpA family phage regulatory protein [Aromatoleum sp.]|jgi:predicted DNA-binding transcriptional regulator AlpA|uniref:helix-turn-helix transcriptional regulator n=1 Tax=Aromatoleum sp. TaxID=2307007 RepID=UPI0028947316|nr:AlpA family phage regulatory protein [Aromatoleum sp.]MDT3669518.1 AlpA family phage regulatory protein [Aromatoleum sp.]
MIKNEARAEAVEVVGRLPETGYVRPSQLVPVILPISHPTLWRWVKAGKFPKPVKLSGRVSAWRVEDVRAWLKNPTAV